MIIYGLDPASACGWSVFKSGKPVACGTWDLSHHRMEGAGFRWIRLRGYLNQMLEAYERPVAVFREEPAGGWKSGQAARINGSVCATIDAWCEDQRIPYSGVNTTEVKRAFVGKGNASKDVMLAEARRRWPHLDIIDHNAADALAIGFVGTERMGV